MDTKIPGSDMTEAAQLKARDEAFEKFLSEPATKFLLSYVPESKDVDAVRTILRSSFDTGFQCGGAFFVADLLKTIFAAKMKRP